MRRRRALATSASWEDRPLAPTQTLPAERESECRRITMRIERKGAAQNVQRLRRDWTLVDHPQLQGTHISQSSARTLLFLKVHNLSLVSRMNGPFRECGTRSFPQGVRGGTSDHAGPTTSSVRYRWEGR